MSPFSPGDPPNEHTSSATQHHPVTSRFHSEWLFGEVLVPVSSRPAGQGLSDRQRDRENVRIALPGFQLDQDDAKGSPSGVKWVTELLACLAQAQPGLPTAHTRAATINKRGVPGREVTTELCRKGHRES